MLEGTEWDKRLALFDSLLIPVFLLYHSLTKPASHYNIHISHQLGQFIAFLASCVATTLRVIVVWQYAAGFLLQCLRENPSRSQMQCGLMLASKMSRESSRPRSLPCKEIPTRRGKVSSHVQAFYEKSATSGRSSSILRCVQVHSPHRSPIPLYNWQHSLIGTPESWEKLIAFRAPM